MDEARLIRFGAGKTHLGAAFHAQWLLVEIILGFVLWHTPKPASLGGGPRVPHRFPSTNNQNLLFTGRTPFRFTSHKIIQIQLGRCPIFLVGPACHDLERLVGQ
jgi:hypothetical protein